MLRGSGSTAVGPSVTESTLGAPGSAGPVAGGSHRAVPPMEAAAIASIQKKLTSHLGARVAVNHSPKRGKIVIEYAGNDDLQRILEKLGIEA